MSRRRNQRAAPKIIVRRRAVLLRDKLFGCGGACAARPLIARAPHTDAAKALANLPKWTRRRQRATSEEAAPARQEAPQVTCEQ